jgi:two-component system cell cycle response regulator DivK
MVSAQKDRAKVAEATPPLVLVVDDSADARALYGEYLEYLGFRVETAENGAQAIQSARGEWRPAIIIMDLAMPEVDGWQAIKRLKSDPSTADIPIVALSAYSFGEEPQRAREAGADLCLSKPCLPSQLARVIRAMLVKRNR